MEENEIRNYKEVTKPTTQWQLDVDDACACMDWRQPEINHVVVKTKYETPKTSNTMIKYWTHQLMTRVHAFFRLIQLQELYVTRQLIQDRLNIIKRYNIPTTKPTLWCTKTLKAINPPSFFCIKKSTVGCLSQHTNVCISLILPRDRRFLLAYSSFIS